MKIILFIISILTVSMCYENVKKKFEDININYVKYNAIAAELAWETSINPGNIDAVGKTAKCQRDTIIWQQNSCEWLAAVEKRQLLNSTQRRQTYLLCRGPKFTYSEARKLSYIYEELQTVYNENNVCLKTKIQGNTADKLEAAILEYLSNVKQFFKLQDGVSFASKVAAKNEVDINKSLCLNGEKDFEKVMKFSKNPDVLKWVWLIWRENLGVMKQTYKELVDIENDAAQRNGYLDIGASWRDEMEIPNLKKLCRDLYYSIKPLYTLLHGVTRFYLRRFYGDVVPENGPIPAHLLGNLWSQNWESVLNLITTKNINFEDSIDKLNWTVTHMVKRVEDFYQSIGLPAMTDAFWRESVFENKNGATRCHGTAADMFKDGDYRLLYCSGKTMEDFSILHHEFGHIQYYMAYADQPGLFRQANAALHESIGDAIMYGVMTPQHLHRLGLVNDSILYTDSSNMRDEITDSNDQENSLDTDDKLKLNNDFELKADEENSLNPIEENKDDIEVTLDNNNESEDFEELTENGNEEDINDEDNFTTDQMILLKIALNKIPQIPFGLLIEEYRWKYFEGSINSEELNKEFWTMALEIQGISPPELRGEEYFDIAAKFHVPDNTAYSRYFLASFLQHQIFESLCRAAIFGRKDVRADIPKSIGLNRCDIYGSKAAGKILRDLMTRGHSQHWREILRLTTGHTDITPSALLRYYRPLFKVLLKIVKKHKIPLGW